MSVSSTSLIRRSVIHNSMAIESSAQAPATMKAVTTVRRASKNGDRSFGRVRRDGVHGAGEGAQHLVVVRVAASARRRCRAWPSGVTHSRDQRLAADFRA